MVLPCLQRNISSSSPAFCRAATSLEIQETRESPGWFLTRQQSKRLGLECRVRIRLCFFLQTHFERISSILSEKTSSLCAQQVVAHSIPLHTQLIILGSSLLVNLLLLPHLQYKVHHSLHSLLVSSVKCIFPNASNFFVCHAITIIPL